MTHDIRKIAGATAIAAVLALPAFAQGMNGTQTSPSATPPMHTPAPGGPVPGKVAPGAMGPAGGAGSAAPGMADTGTNTPVKSLAMTGGDRASKIIGASVTNSAKQTVGTVDDLIVTPDDKVPVAVLSVGGFLGMGTKYVAVPFKDLKVTTQGVAMPGATKESLKRLPSFKYRS